MLAPLSPHTWSLIGLRNKSTLINLIYFSYQKIDNSYVISQMSHGHICEDMTNPKRR